MVGHGGSSAGSYLADPTSPIPSHCASIVATSTLRVKKTTVILIPVFTWDTWLRVIPSVHDVSVYKLQVCHFWFTVILFQGPGEVLETKELAKEPKVPGDLGSVF